MLAAGYSPPWAPHVFGMFDERVRDELTGEYEPQTWQATCSRCGQTYGPTKCTTGRVEQKIDAFAQGHTHGAPTPDLGKTGLDMHIERLQQALATLASSHEQLASHPDLHEHAEMLTAEAAKWRAVAAEVPGTIKSQLAARARARARTP